MPESPSNGDNHAKTPAISGSFTKPRVQDEGSLNHQNPFYPAMAPLPSMAFRRKNDRDLTLEYVGAGCSELTGYMPNDLIGNKKVSFRGIIHPSNMGLVEKTIKQAFKKKSPFQHEYRIITSTGQKKWVWEQCWWDLDVHGNPVAMEGYISDITACKNMAKDYPRWAEGVSTTADQSNEGILIIDDFYRIVFANQVACTLLGRKGDEVIGHDLTEFLSETNRHLYVDRPPFMNGNDPGREKHEISIIDGAGQKRRMLITSARITSWAGKERMIVKILDITDLHQNGMMNHGKTPRGDFLSENMADVIWTVDMNLKHTYVSPSVKKVLGYTADELLHQDIEIIMTPESYASAVTTLNSILSCVALMDNDSPMDKYRTLELEMIRKDGSHLWAEIRAAFIRDANRIPIEIMGITRDITLRKRAEEELKSSKEFLSALIDSIDDPMFVKDANHCWIMVNSKACELLGRSREDIVGRHDNDLFDAHRLEHIKRNDERVFLTNRPHTDEEIISWGEKTRTVSILRTPYTDTTTGKRYLTGIIRDITAYKSMEERLKLSHENLERVMSSRTAELTTANERLIREIEVRKKAESDLKLREAELEEKSRDFEEMNTALRILLKKRDEEKADIETTLVSNLKTAVLPYVEKLSATDLNESQRAFVSLITSHIRQIASSYIKELSSEFIQLTPSEIQVASLIKEGKGSKEIASIMNISLNTVLTHRYKIRCKVGLKNSKLNLQSYLNNLE